MTRQSSHDPIPPMFQPGPPAEPEEVFPPRGFVQIRSALPGIDVFAPANANEKTPDLVDFKCPKCGATTAYSVDQLSLNCEHCGYSETPDAERLGKSAEQFEFQVETVHRAQRGWGEARKDLACQRCGGVVSVPPNTISFSCPFCASNKVVFRETLEDVLRPRYLVPFKIDPKSCREITMGWLGASWMIPAELRKSAREERSAVERFHPVYIPYWTFDATANASWKALVGHEKVEVYYEKGERRERRTMEWREESGKVQKTFNDILVPGTTHLNLTALARVDAYNLHDLVLYEPRYLAGIQAQAYDLPLDQAWEAGRQILREQTRRACLDRASSTHVRNFTMSLDFSDEGWRYILVPIYSSVYHYQEKPYQILINGQNGRIAGPRPVDWGKFWLVALAILAPGLVTALVGLVMPPSESAQMTVLLGLFLIVVGLVVNGFLFRQAQEMENV